MKIPYELHKEIQRHWFIVSHDMKYLAEFEPELSKTEIIEQAALEFLSIVAQVAPSRAAALRITTQIIDKLRKPVIGHHWPIQPRVMHPATDDPNHPMTFFKKREKQP